MLIVVTSLSLHLSFYRSVPPPPPPHTRRKSNDFLDDIGSATVCSRLVLSFDLTVVVLLLLFLVMVLVVVGRGCGGGGREIGGTGKTTVIDLPATAGPGLRSVLEFRR